MNLDLATVQADIWAKRGEADDIYELDPLLEEEEANTRSAIGRLVDELAHQGHLLFRHKEGLKCKACNVYRADRQFNFWSRTLRVPRCLERASKTQRAWAATFGMWVLRGTRVERRGLVCRDVGSLDELGDWVVEGRVTSGTARSGPGGDKMGAHRANYERSCPSATVQEPVFVTNEIDNAR